jgi:hypothetical protein
LFEYQFLFFVGSKRFISGDEIEICRAKEMNNTLAATIELGVVEQGGWRAVSVGLGMA